MYQVSNNQMSQNKYLSGKLVGYCLYIDTTLRHIVVLCQDRLTEITTFIVDHQAHDNCFY